MVSTDPGLDAMSRLRGYIINTPKTESSTRARTHSAQTEGIEIASCACVLPE